MKLSSKLLKYCTDFAEGCLARDPFPDETAVDFQNECLSESNRYRAEQGAPPLTIDQDAVEYAQSRCQLISQYDGLSYGHAGLDQTNYGENLYWGGNSAPVLSSCKEAIHSWYKEGENYDWNNPGFSDETGHFTQLVWESTTGVGCARCGGQGDPWYETYIVCDYTPPGNVEGQFQDNVQ